ncbi:MAG: ATP-binding protein, partial [Cyclobacteriaceae bacterium]|nr:ATP-binding protein [Cyclobacteriaceae bacterium]
MNWGRYVVTGLLLTCVQVSLLAQISKIQFDRVGFQEGLSQTTVYAIFQDSKGFMWFGTRDGLHKYDGYSFKVYRNKPEDPKSLSNNTVRVIFEYQSKLWVGTEKGLNVLNLETEKFNHYLHDPTNPQSLSHDRIRDIALDQSGSLWIATNGGGMNKLMGHATEGSDENDFSFEHYRHHSGDPHSLSDDRVYTLYPGSNGGIWVGTVGGGLNKLKTEDGTFTRYLHNPNDPTSLSDNIVNTIYEDKFGVLWVGTRAGGLNVLLPQSTSFKHYLHDPAKSKSLGHNNVNVIAEDHSGVLWVGTYGGGLDFVELPITDNKRADPLSFAMAFEHNRHHGVDSRSLSNDLIRSIYEDQSGIIWVGTSEGGLNKFDKRRRKFEHYQYEVNNPYSLSAKSVSSIYEDSQGGLWIGTYGGGLNKLSTHQDPGAIRKFEHYRHQPENLHSLSNDVVLTIYQDRQATMWFGTISGGLNEYNNEKGTFIHYKHDSQSPTSLSNDRVTSILEDPVRDQVLWIGTYGGLNKFDRGTDVFVHYRHHPDDPKSLSDDNISQVYADKLGILWIATRAGGLNKFNPETGEFTRYLHRDNDSTSISTNEINMIHESRSHPRLLWIGTYGGGLNRFDIESETFIHYREKDGLANDVIDGILEDDGGNLWLSTNGGVSKFNPTTGIFRNYDLSDGLQNNEFNMGAYHQSQVSGEMFFGGINGFNSFHPEKGIEDDPYVPQIVITDFQIFNKSVSFGDPNIPSPLEKSVTSTQEITLSYQESVFSFEFAALHYSLPEKNQYAYKMEGFDTDWNYINNRRFTTFTALPAGEYIFRVKGSNPDGVWNETGTAISIIITPPWWKTWWAYGLYILGLSSMIIGYVRYKTQIQAKELAQERRVTEQLRRVDKLKDEFLANTSHELRTPLNGIIGITESMMDGAAGELSEQANVNLSMVASSGKRLASLVNDILDFSKLKTRSLELNKKPTDMRVLTDIVLKFSEPLLKPRELSLINSVPKSIPLVDGDPDRLQQILHNIIDNAIKFSEKGKIEVKAVEKDGLVYLSVTDQGMGIPHDKLSSVFQSFEQLDASIEREHGGTGLGLAITRQLVELHGGTIEVDSQLGEGSTFTFTIPISQEQSAQGMVEADGARDIPKISRVREAVEVVPDERHEASKSNGEFKILVVDDEAINHQVYLNYLSSENYAVTQAFSGKEALEAIHKSKDWDLILLDLMMPKMSGYEVCRRLRDNYLPTELPVIIITAKDQVSDLVQGFACGANDYLAKPFTKHEFLARVKTHLNLFKINHAYGRFVPHEFLKTLGKESIVDVGLGDQVQEEMTIMFCDIRSYSTLSESMSPKETFNFLNAYLSKVGPIIRENHGFVNQYYGDGIMAVYQSKAENAVKSSIEMQKRVAAYNLERKAKNRKPMKIGIGLHTGPLMLGIIGDKQRMDTGAVADSVNIASRMEGLTKFYGSSIVVSEYTLKSIGRSQEYNHRFLGKVQVKGREGAISVYEIFDGDSERMIELKMSTKT